ncbi:hypothetical protein [Rurimicrobium arvi]|uniref:Uncharacterized protein n=1 Tax=Rurimicrobium arvi TaxID=2049916 RepID=A0ABP8MTR3_9BACT
MEYQFSSFDQWITKLQYDPDILPPLSEWEEQLSRKKQELTRHFRSIRKSISDSTSLRLYVTHHYRSLNCLIETLLYEHQIHTALLLNVLEQLKFMLEIQFQDMIAPEEDHPVFSYLSVEELALLVNTLIECGAIRVRSKKELARQASKYLLFVSNDPKHTAAESFYNALFSNKTATMNSALKWLTKIHTHISKASRINSEQR